jgi:hypothetical protein
VPSLLQILQALEVELHHPDVRRNPARLAQLLHPEFHEGTRVGTVYKGQVNCCLVSQKHDSNTQESTGQDHGSLLTFLADIARMCWANPAVLRGQYL